MNHSLNTRVPSLVAGTEYAMKIWDAKPLFLDVVFVGYSHNGEFGGKIPALNKMNDADVLHFRTASGLEFTGMVQNCCLTLASGSRLTFFKLNEDDVSKGPVGVVQFDEEFTVAEEKLARKRRLDRENKAAKRAAAKLAA